MLSGSGPRVAAGRTWPARRPGRDRGGALVAAARRRGALGQDTAERRGYRHRLRDQQVLRPGSTSPGRSTVKLRRCLSAATHRAAARHAGRRISRVRGHAAAERRPLGGPFRRDGDPTRLQTFQNVVSPRYFDTMGIALLMGRQFSSRDDERAPAVAVLNESLARLLWPDASALGRRLRSRTAAWRSSASCATSKAGTCSKQPARCSTCRCCSRTSRTRSLHIRSSVPPAQLAPLLRREVAGARPGPACLRHQDARRACDRNPDAAAIAGAPDHRVRDPRAAARRDRPVWPAGAQRDRADRRDWHPHGARRPQGRTSCGCSWRVA